MVGLYAIIIASCGMIVVIVSQTGGPTRIPPSFPPSASPVTESAGSGWGFILFLVVAAGLFLFLVAIKTTKGGITRRTGKIRGWVAQVLSSPDGKDKKWPAVATFMGMLALIGAIVVGLTLIPVEKRELLGAPISILFYLIIVAIVFLATREKGVTTFLTSLATIALVVVLLFLTYSWWPTTPLTHRSAKASVERSATSSRANSQTIIARPGVYSNRVSIPFGQIFNVRPQGKINTLTASGKTWDDWPGRPGAMRYNVSPEDAMFQFMSLEEKEVEVIVEWEPK